MATIATTLATAWQYQQAGNFAQAEYLYRQALQAEPGNADAWRQLGKCAQALGRLDEAIAHFRQAVGINPHDGDVRCDLGIAQANKGQLEEATRTFQEAVERNPANANAANNLGVALAMLGKHQEAAGWFRQAIRAQPGNPGYLGNLGNALFDTGHLDEAVATYRQALRLQPNAPANHYGMGNALRQQGNLEEAAAHYRESIRLAPTYARAHHGLGTTLADQRKHQEAIACFQHVLRLEPNFAEAHHGLGMAFAEQGNFDAASARYREAVRLKPDFPEAWNNLGNALLLQDKQTEAVAHYRQALQLRPDFPEAHKNLGNALYSQCQLDEAVAHYDQALQLKQDYGEVHWNRSLVRLLVGDFEKGWPEYEWRWTQPGFQRRSYAQPRWDGSDLRGKTIFIYAEQGLGDTLQFIRYLPLVKQRGGTVIFECQLPLMRLLASFPGIDQLVAPGMTPQAFDVQAPLLSLPGILHTDLDSIPAAVPYLDADAELVEQWRQQLKAVAGFKVGIAWHGSTAHPRNGDRSFPLAYFSALAQVEGVRLISLQKGQGTEQLQGLADKFPVADLGNRLDETSGPFMDTAAIMKHLDLVISCDTAIVHLGGALGVPVWVALPLVPDWRWLLHREDSPWYPTLRLFRQTRFARWDDVFDRIAAELRERTKQKPAAEQSEPPSTSGGLPGR